MFIKTTEDAVQFIQELLCFSGAERYDGSASIQVVFPLKNGKFLRIGCTDDDVAEEPGLWADQFILELHLKDKKEKTMLANISGKIKCCCGFHDVHLRVDTPNEKVKVCRREGCGWAQWTATIEVVQELPGGGCVLKVIE